MNTHKLKPDFSAMFTLSAKKQTDPLFSANKRNVSA